MPELPFSSEELARRLSRELAPRPDGIALSVSDPVLVEEADRLVLRLQIAARPTGEVWELRFPLDPVDLDLDPVAFVLVLRANIEEWWDCKDAEPHVATWGHRIG
ncbi:hypothetical protein ACIBI3_31900 [Actinomadura luteofluorescens]|uniref:hypothetical protein n=1 Tax=Actinomadura luteofluorescens TaxID=46163 RepID=UPI003471FB23